LCTCCVLFILLSLPPICTLFPYTTLFRSGARTFVSMRLEPVYADADGSYIMHGLPPGHYRPSGEDPYTKVFGFGGDIDLAKGEQDRKSTRLNSSHRTISYAVFCLKKNIDN